MQKSPDLDRYLAAMRAELESLPTHLLAERVARDCGIQVSPAELRVRMERLQLAQERVNP